MSKFALFAVLVTTAAMIHFCSEDPPESGKDFARAHSDQIFKEDKKLWPNTHFWVKGKIRHSRPPGVGEGGGKKVWNFSTLAPAFLK